LTGSCHLRRPPHRLRDARHFDGHRHLLRRAAVRDVAGGDTLPPRASEDRDPMHLDVVASTLPVGGPLDSAANVPLVSENWCSACPSAQAREDRPHPRQRVPPTSRQGYRRYRSVMLLASCRSDQYLERGFPIWHDAPPNTATALRRQPTTDYRLPMIDRPTRKGPPHNDGTPY
jgi:hypothetical protein